MLINGNYINNVAREINEKRYYFNNFWKLNYSETAYCERRGLAAFCNQ